MIEQAKLLGPLSLNIFGVGIEVYYDSQHIVDVLRTCFMAFEGDVESVTLKYEIRSEVGGGYTLNNYSLDLTQPNDDSDLIYSVEKDIELELQRIFKSLYFIHGAALRYQDQVCILMAPSGSGKSTLTWGLVNHGFVYMSDELSPIDMSSMEVNSYPIALCLKSKPPEPYALPDDTQYSPVTMHVPVNTMPSGHTLIPGKLRAVFFVSYDEQADAPALNKLTKGEAAAHLYANGLNQLAHGNRGLVAAAKIAESVEAYNIVTTRNLEACSQLIKSVF